MITCIGIITYPNVFETAPNPSGVQKFSCSLLIDKTDKKGLAELQAEVAKAIEKGKEKKWKGKVPNFRYQAIRDGDEELASGDREGKEYEGRMFINTSATEDSPPGVVGPDAKPLMDRGALYSGCRVRLDVRAFPYDNSGNKGVGWWLNNVMLVGDGERLDGKMNAVDAFASYADTSEAEDESLA